MATRRDRIDFLKDNPDLCASLSQFIPQSMRCFPNLPDDVDKRIRKLFREMQELNLYSKRSAVSTGILNDIQTAHSEIMLDLERRASREAPSFTQQESPKRIKDWVGGFVQAMIPIRNSLGEMPSGTIYRVTCSSGMTVWFESIACPCCQLKFRFSRQGSDKFSRMIYLGRELPKGERRKNDKEDFL